MPNRIQLATQPKKTKVAEHLDTHVNKIRGYITQVVDMLDQLGLCLIAAWLDPSDPRDATIRYRLDGQDRALVWDEETGWRDGEFVSGRQGVRTTLYDVTYIGNEVLPTPTRLAKLLSGGRGSTEPTKYRSYAARDDLETRLRAYNEA